MPKVVVLTGASSGIGLECAQLLLKKGYKIYALSRKMSTIKELEHPQCVRLDCDLCDLAQLEACAQEILTQESCLDGVIHNAGRGLFGALEEQPLAQVEQLFALNLFSIGRLNSLLLKALRANSNSSKLIHVSSSAGRSISMFLGWYHASKYALEAYSDALRVELAPFGVQVVLIEPGAIQTKWGEGAFGAYVSQPSPYKVELDKSARFYAKTYQSADSPLLVARTILQALESDRPKTRYLVGKYAHLLVWAKKWLPDKLYDTILRKRILG
ncbi:SDR family NAD(P)-dependent oxidoreductase [Helicobacter cynogastricus]|uniref:OMP543 n=1 Tax=Helicobacter cynogastricus TaxID=329937 RepID=A0A1R3UCS3_9HELI|nr:SDR family NAD(P)-dependent oxidoreductase [Helicobacter cynogastricus]SFZ72096.1 OMP543 [Helicobacter cynogastricus]